MPIQFDCQECGKTLSVADEHAGKLASCPDCKTVTKIPAGGDPSGAEAIPQSGAAANPFGQSAPFQPADGGYSQNPYAAPTIAQSKPKSFAKSGPIRPRKVGFEEVMSSAWELWMNNLGLLVGVTVVVMLVNIVFSFVAGVTEEIFTQMANDEIMGFLAGQVVSIGGGIVGLFLGIGQVRIFLDIARGRNADFGTLFSGGDRFLTLLGATIVAYLCLIPAFLLLIVPGVILCLFFWGYYFLIVDRNAGAMESFSMAYEFCQMNSGTTLLIWLVSILIAIAGLLAFCIGIIFAAPLISMMYAVAYLKMSGQMD